MVAEEMRLDRALVNVGRTLAIAGVLLIAGCEPPPAAPTPVPAASPPAGAPSLVQVSIRGQVVDTVERVVPAALVEIVDGPLAGARRSTDAEGRFEFTGTALADSLVTLRVSKAGFEPGNIITTWQRAPGGRVVWTRLHSLDPPLAFDGGDYAVTISFDKATASGFPPTPGRPEITCLGLPAEFTSRTYDASITERPLGERWVRISGPTVEPFAASFALSVAGDVAAVTMEEFIGERFPENRYLFIGGGPVPTRFTIDSGAVYLPFAADFRYCELSSPRGIYNECSQVPLDLVVRQHWCRSYDVMMKFVRR